MQRFWLVVSLLALAAWPGFVFAQPASSPAPAPATLHGVLSIEGKQVPLPEGDWIPAGLATTAGGMVSAALLQMSGNAVNGAVLVQVNHYGTALNWGLAPACSREDLPLARIRYQSDHDGSCAYAAVIDDTAPDHAVDQAWRGVRRRAEASGWALPARWSMAVIRVTTPREALQVRYVFRVDDQSTASLPQANSALAAWTEAVWDDVERGLHNQLDPSRSLPPLAIATRPSTGAAVMTSGQPITLPRAVWKTVTFRVISTTVDFTTNLVVIGDLVTAAALSSAAIILGPPLYLAHELAWDYYGSPATRHVDLAGIGADPR